MRPNDQQQQTKRTSTAPKHGSSLTLEQLGLPPSVCKKARSCRLDDTNAIAMQSEEALQQLGFTERQISIVRNRLELIGRVQPRASRSDEGEVDGKADIDDVSPDPIPKTSNDGSYLAGERLREGDLVVPDFGNDLFTLPTAETEAISDNDRAQRSATKAVTTAAGRPTLNHPRVIDLLDSITMSVEDAAFILNRSRDALYDALRRDPASLPIQRVGQSISVLSQPFLRQIGLK